MEPIRVMVVDDHPLFREALCGAIEADAQMQIVGEAASGAQAIEQAQMCSPDVIVMDLYLPGMNGIEATAKIIAANPAARVLILTSSHEDEKIVEAVRAGALGYLLKETNREQLLDGIRKVAGGETYLPGEIAEKLVRGIRQTSIAQVQKDAYPERLTRREQEVLELLAEGASNRAISRRLSIDESTVRVHVHNIIEKLGLEDRSQAIVYAFRKTEGK